MNQAPAANLASVAFAVIAGKISFNQINHRLPIGGSRLLLGYAKQCCSHFLIEMFLNEQLTISLAILKNIP